MKRLNNIGVIRLLLISLLMVLVAAGCGKKPVELNGPQKDELKQGNEQTGSSADPEQAKTKVTLYFSDDQAMYLLPEQREVNKNNDETIESVIIRELSKGPENKSLGKVIPDGTKLLSVKVTDGVAYVDFSKEFRDKHWGGSAGETMTIYSVVDSLCNLPNIDKVQFLLEGEKVESILNGNMDTSVPIGPDYNLVKSQ